MKNLKIVGGTSLIATALILTFLALFFPDNGMFTALWNAGFFTFRADPSLMVIYIASALLFVTGSILLPWHFQRNKGDV